MSAGSVSVLCPNGRRITVQYTPNTTILQVLEEVCNKQNLKVEEYELKHHNKTLNTSLIFRFSGLPNNAQFELVPATRVRLESDIILAISMENGNRLVEKFTPSQTLRTVLETLCPEYLSVMKSPVVIYMRQEIFGNKLDTVTLRSLGITEGRAMIRLIDKSPEELKMQANVVIPLPHKPLLEKPFVRKIKESFQVENDGKMDSDESQPSNNSQGGNIQSKDFKKNENVDVFKLAKEKRKNLDSLFNKGKRQNILEEKMDFPKCSPESITQSKELCKCERNLTIQLPYEKCEENCVGISDEKIEDQFVFLGERNAMLFSMKSVHAMPSEELPDEFFDLTIEDAKNLLRDIRLQQNLNTNSPLMTAALRNLEESKKQIRQLNKYIKTIIRIQFPDRTVLQGTFKPTETIRDVREFIRDYLEDKLVQFYLYSTPPKKNLEDSEILFQLGFVPGALIHFGTNNTQYINYLRKDLQDKFTSNSIASLAAAKMRKQNTRMCDADEVDDDLNMNVDVPDISNDTPSTSTGITNASEMLIKHTKSNIPKWFKQ